jgi:hypothetical protein
VLFLVVALQSGQNNEGKIRVLPKQFSLRFDCCMNKIVRITVKALSQILSLVAIVLTKMLFVLAFYIKRVRDWF